MPRAIKKPFGKADGIRRDKNPTTMDPPTKFLDAEEPVVETSKAAAEGLEKDPAKELKKAAAKEPKNAATKEPKKAPAKEPKKAPAKEPKKAPAKEPKKGTPKDSKKPAAKDLKKTTARGRGAKNEDALVQPQQEVETTTPTLDSEAPPTGPNLAETSTAGNPDHAAETAGNPYLAGSDSDPQDEPVKPAPVTTAEVPALVADIAANGKQKGRKRGTTSPKTEGTAAKKATVAKKATEKRGRKITKASVEHCNS